MKRELSSYIKEVEEWFAYCENYANCKYVITKVQPEYDEEKEIKYVVIDWFPTDDGESCKYYVTKNGRIYINEMSEKNNIIENVIDADGDQVAEDFKKKWFVEPKLVEKKELEYRSPINATFNRMQKEIENIQFDCQFKVKAYEDIYNVLEKLLSPGEEMYFVIAEEWSAHFTSSDIISKSKYIYIYKIEEDEVEPGIFTITEMEWK